MRIVKFKSPENPGLPSNALYGGAAVMAVLEIDHLTQSGRVSAWYDWDNQVLGAEFIDKNGTCRSLPARWCSVWHGIEKIGHTYGRV